MIILSENINKKILNKALKIYNFYISNSFSNFEEKQLSIIKFNNMYKKIKSNKLPFLIAVNKEEIIGIAFVNKFRDKSGYRFTHEHSIYVSPEFLNQGYGSKILKQLIKICRLNKDIKQLIAVIGGSDNYASIKMHKKLGFEYVGTLKKVGYKKNKWIDSVYMQKKL